MQKRFVISAAAVPVLAVIAAIAGGLAEPAAGNGSNPARELSRARAATAQYHDVDRAVADGYAEFRDSEGIACIDLPGVGGMGTHFVSSSVGDTVLDAESPEALVYETKRGGRLRLVAVEYIVFEDAWNATHNAPPSLFGQRFTLIEAGNRYGIPAFYELHAWIWKHNPRGLFDDWNPNVTCNHAN